MSDSAALSFDRRDVAELSIEHDVTIDRLTGGASVRVPVALTPGRSGFGPAIALQYNSSSQNSPYGIGWSLAGVPAVGLDTRDGLPKYDGSDRFAFNGNEELVPILEPTSHGAQQPRVVDGPIYAVHYFRRRVEEQFVRFEKWVHQMSGRVHWRSRDTDDVVSVYGSRPSDEGRIQDPDDPGRTWRWLLEAQLDKFGNAILFHYATEDTSGVDIGRSFERGRVDARFPSGQRYLKRIVYGNTKPFQPDAVEPPGNQWLFEAVFDFGDHQDTPHPTASPSRPWPARRDAFSTYRSGFEVRTHRLCRRVLMFHRFSELGTGPTLVGATQLELEPDDAGTALRAIRYTGYRRDASSGAMTSRTLPPLTFSYSEPAVDTQFHEAAENTSENVPGGLNDPTYRWLDAFGDGLPGILTQTKHAWYYKPNEGGGSFGAQRLIAEKPALEPGAFTFSDFDGNGNPKLVVLQGRQAGFYELDRHGEAWQDFRLFESTPQLQDSHAQWLDLTGDGRPDLVTSGHDGLTLYPSLGKTGFGEAVDIPARSGAATAIAHGPQEDPQLDLLFADMSGDGLLDQVHIRNGRVEYWPHLGRGRFGDSIVMEDAPVFDFELDLGRLRFVDLDGTGTADLVYIGRGEIRTWLNASGNRFVAGPRLQGLPYIDDLSSVQILDFLGDGTPCLVWSALAGLQDAQLQYLQLMGGVKPRLLLSVDNGLGRETRLTYGTSSQHYLRDIGSGRGWSSKLPSHVTVVDRKEVLDHIAGNRLVSRFEYHDGFFDGEERAFRGFGHIDQYDAELLDVQAEGSLAHTESTCVRTWTHRGAPGCERRTLQDAYQGDPNELPLPHPSFEDHDLTPREYDDAFRTLAGQTLRQELFGITPTGARHAHPYQVTQTTYRVRRLQHATTEHRAVFLSFPSEQVTSEYERAPDDPRLSHQLLLAVDDYGSVLEECAIAYPRRRSGPEVVAAQKRVHIEVSRRLFVHTDVTERYDIATPVEHQQFEVAGLSFPGAAQFSWEDVRAQTQAALATPLAFTEPLDDGADAPRARLFAWERSFYWNDALTDVLPHGEVGNKALVHHEASACFPTDMVSPVFGAWVDTALLRNEGRYVEDGARWWRPGPVQHYLPAAGFFSLAKITRPDGGATTYTWDTPYFLTYVEVRDALDNRTRALIDYHLMQPSAITDPNENVQEALHDPLGLIVVSSSRGEVLGPTGAPAIYGHEPLTAYVPQADEGVDTALAEPERFLQGAAEVVIYDLDSWMQSGTPPRMLSLVREEWTHDARGGSTATGPIHTTLSYSDGFGRALQQKQRTEAGPAISRDTAGSVVVGVDGAPEVEHAGDRWIVSGHTVFNHKQKPIRQYEPFFSSTPAFESDDELRSYGVSSALRYDALGRVVREELPHGAYTRVETTPWEVRRHDANDTVSDSVYRTLREGLPNGDVEKQALVKAEAHADTPSISRLDPLGREVVQIEIGEGGRQIVTESELDAQGNVVAVIDPRGIRAFTYRLDMLGRILHENSADAGERWSLPDAMDQPIHEWDGRDVHKRVHFDPLGRPTSVSVDGLSLNHVMERLVYGEDASVTEAARRNARGRLVEYYDQAGVVRIGAYDIVGNVLKTDRHLAQDSSAEPDWTDPTLVPVESSPFSMESRYDALGRVIEQKRPDGTQHRTEYLRGGGVGRMLVSTEDGRLNDVEVLADASYNARGQRGLARFGNDVEVRASYDAETFRLRRLTARRPTADVSGWETIQDIAYTHDPAGNVVHCVDEAQQPSAPAPVLQGLAVSSHGDYTYDPQYKLVVATGRVHQSLLEHDHGPAAPNTVSGTRHLVLNNGAAVERYTRTYSYDDSGNIRRIRHVGTSRTWSTELWISSSSNRSLPAFDQNGVHVANPETRFDANGNLQYLPSLRQMEWRELRGKDPELFASLNAKAERHTRALLDHAFGSTSEELRELIRAVDLGSVIDEGQDLAAALLEQLGSSKIPEELLLEGTRTIETLSQERALSLPFGPDTPITKQAFFQRELKRAVVHRLLDAAEISDDHAEAVIEIAGTPDRLTGNALETLVERGILDEEGASKLGLSVSLYGILDEDLELAAFVASTESPLLPLGHVTQLKDLVHLDVGTWRQIFASADALPDDYTPDTYARQVANRIGRLYKTGALLSRLRRAAADPALNSHLDTLTPLVERYPKLFAEAAFDRLDPEERDIAKESCEQLQRIVNTYPGMNLAELIDDAELPAPEKVERLRQRIGLVDEVEIQNPGVELLLLDLSPGSADLNALSFGGLNREQKRMVLSTFKAWQRTYALTRSLDPGRSAGRFRIHVGGPDSYGPTPICGRERSRPRHSGDDHRHRTRHRSRRDRCDVDHPRPAPWWIRMDGCRQRPSVRGRLPEETRRL